MEVAQNGWRLAGGKILLLLVIALCIFQFIYPVSVPIPSLSCKKYMVVYRNSAIHFTFCDNEPKYTPIFTNNDYDKYKSTYSGNNMAYYAEIENYNTWENYISKLSEFEEVENYKFLKKISEKTFLQYDIVIGTIYANAIGVPRLAFNSHRVNLEISVPPKPLEILSSQESIQTYQMLVLIPKKISNNKTINLMLHSQ